MNIQTVVTDTAIFPLLSQVMNDVTGVINHDKEITHVNITRVRLYTYLYTYIIYIFTLYTFFQYYIYVYIHSENLCTN